MDLMRVATAGSVDDGKSTLIGRLLLDTGSVADDHLDELRRASAEAGRDELDLSLLTDGLRAEREQGITIDVAYRYFGTGRRAFVLADAPGHEQYTRNMVTAASNADLALILTDVSRGLTDQTRRHLAVVSMMRVPRIVACVNKMDMVDYSEQSYQDLRTELLSVARSHGLAEVDVIPISARHGDNVVTRSDRMPWYDGQPLLAYLEHVKPASSGGAGLRLPIQVVLRQPRPDGIDRWYAGRLAGGDLGVGDRLIVLPGQIETAVRAIRDAGGEVEHAEDRTSVAVALTDDIDLARGGMLASATAPPQPLTSLNADICWLGEEPLKAGMVYSLRHTTRWVRAVVQEVHHRLDIRTGSVDIEAEHLARNELGSVRCELSEPLFVDLYQDNRTTGCFVLVDDLTAGTVGAGMISHDC
jgi:bifunctional enzyme CysN/CysC